MQYFSQLFQFFPFLFLWHPLCLLWFHMYVLCLVYDLNIQSCCYLYFLDVLFVSSVPCLPDVSEWKFSLLMRYVSQSYCTGLVWILNGFMLHFICKRHLFVSWNSFVLFVLFHGMLQWPILFFVSFLGKESFFGGGGGWRLLFRYIGYCFLCH